MDSKNRKVIAVSLKWYDIRIHQGILQYAKTRDWDVLANPHDPWALDVPTADGQIVMLGPNDPRRTRLTEKLKIPVVDLGAYNTLDLPRVLPDNVMVGRLAAEEFLSRGFKTLSVFSTQTHWYVGERQEGFCSVVEKAGLACNCFHLKQSHLHKGFFNPSGSEKARLYKWLRQTGKPMGIYTIEDESAAMLMRACHQLELAVPEQVALIGTNNDPLICPYTEIPLSSVDIDWKNIGYQAAAYLDKLMRGQKPRKTPLIVPPAGVVCRKSSDTLAVEDLRVSKALSYIQDNSHRHISVTEITENLDIPLRTLQWAFQKSVNCSIQDQINKQRLKRVKDLLVNSDRKVGQISEDLGFSSAQYLNHFFTKITGCTPNEYRRRHKKDDNN
jgi:LacI family transcriptional regulator